MQNISNIHNASVCGNNYLKPVLPGCLHLNPVALNLSNMPLTISPPPLPGHTSPATVISGSEVCTHVDDYSSQTTMPNADKSDQQSHKKRRLVNICLFHSLSLEIYSIDGDFGEYFCRRKLQNDDVESGRHCSCKKSKCLKL